jgi:vancomycin resistance protein YoaR
VKLFFCTVAIFITAVMFSGCGTSSGSGSGGQDYATKMADVTISGTGLPKTNAPLTDREPLKPASPETAQPETISPETARPDAASPDPAVEKTRNVPSNNVRENKSVRSVAENVRLGKENIGGMTEAELLSKLKEISLKTDIAAIDAGYDVKTWKMKDSKSGKKLDTDMILKAAFSAKKGQVIQYSYSPVKPQIDSKQLKGKIKLIGQFSTPFLDRSKSRIKNIRITSAKLDGKIIQPGREFSFNASTGSKSKKYGYENATVIVKTPKGPKHKKAPGGGVCQISTTLYNAVMKSGLKVTERHEHSDDVHYVPDGKDATVTYGGPDFRFVNNRSNPIMLRITVHKRSLQVKIYENSAPAVRK